LLNGQLTRIDLEHQALIFQIVEDITLPGYQTFETDIELVANQKSTIKTELVKISASEEAFNANDL